MGGKESGEGALAVETAGGDGDDVHSPKGLHHGRYADLRPPRRLPAAGRDRPVSNPNSKTRVWLCPGSETNKKDFLKFMCGNCRPRKRLKTSKCLPRKTTTCSCGTTTTEDECHIQSLRHRRGHYGGQITPRASGLRSLPGPVSPFTLSPRHQGLS